MSCLLPPVCAFCAHLLENEERDCQAFSEIPETIMRGENDHHNAIEGDNGISFTLIAELRNDFDEINALRQQMGMTPFSDSK